MNWHWSWTGAGGSVRDCWGWSMSLVHVPGPCPCPWSMSLVHVHVHGPCPWSMSMSMSMVHVHGPWSMSMVHVHVHGPCLLWFWHWIFLVDFELLTSGVILAILSANIINTWNKGYILFERYYIIFSHCCKLNTGLQLAIVYQSCLWWGER